MKTIEEELKIKATTFQSDYLIKSDEERGYDMKSPIDRVEAVNMMVDFHLKMEQSKWVRVEDGLPIIPEGENHIRCLVEYKSSHGKSRVMEAVFSADGNFKFNGKFQLNKSERVIRWSCLPEPPKE